jgi:hypothetical protein
MSDLGDPLLVAGGLVGYHSWSELLELAFDGRLSLFSSTHATSEMQINFTAKVC